MKILKKLFLFFLKIFWKKKNKIFFNIENLNFVNDEILFINKELFCKMKHFLVFIENEKKIILDEFENLFENDI